MWPQVCKRPWVFGGRGNGKGCWSRGVACGADRRLCCARQELYNIQYMGFAPKMTEAVGDVYLPSDFGSVALFALVNLKEKIGPCSCAQHPCPLDRACCDRLVW